MDLIDGYPIVPPTFEATCTVTGSSVSGALALGGSGGSGGASGAGGAGGLAQGGGIAVAFRTLPSSFLVRVSASTLSGDSAIGGAGGSGGARGDGGDGQGGGLFVDPDSTVALADDAIIGNLADGGSGATNGTGLGGGVYLSSTGSTRKNTAIAGNAAATGNNDLYGTFS